MRVGSDYTHVSERMRSLAYMEAPRWAFALQSSCFDPRHFFRKAPTARVPSGPGFRDILAATLPAAPTADPSQALARLAVRP